MKDKIFETYRAGLRTRDHPTRDYAAAVRAAVEEIERKESTHVTHHKASAAIVPA